MSLELNPEAQARLNDKSWRRAQSKWMLWIHLSIGIFGAVGFARLSIKTKDTMLKKYSYLFLGLMSVLFLLMGLDDSTTTQVDGKDVTENSTVGNIGAALLVVNYGLQVYFSFKANKIWLVFRAQNNNLTWTAENLNVPVVTRIAPTVSEELVKDVAGIQHDEFYSSPKADASEKVISPAPLPTEVIESARQESSKIDLNSASVEILMQKAEFDPALAANTVVQREKRGGFSSFEEFANDLNLQPHQLAKLKPMLIVEKRTETGGSSGRILDI
jgi:DNA uptake protein ComE-like DNA-binding protein